MPRDRERPGPGGARPALVSLAAVVVTVAVVLVAVLASATGPTPVLEGRGPVLDRVTTEPPVETTTPDESLDDELDRLREEDREGLSLQWVGTLVRTLLLLLAVGALVLTVVTWVRDRPRRRRPRRDGPDPDYDLVDPVAAVADALAEAAEEQDAALSGGSPRNGIVEAWLRFEVLAERAGAPREPWETSTEFTARLLGSVGADARATARLAELYRLARFSDHELGEHEREAAAEALRRIRDHAAAAREPR
jgi:hypothetical protein